MSKVTTDHPLWPDFVKWFRLMWGHTPNLAIKENGRLWECFLAGAAASRTYEARTSKDVGLVITQEGLQEDE